MRVSGRINPMAAAPAGRLLRPSRIAAAHASRRRQRDPVAASDVRAEVRQGRLTAAGLRREIARLGGEAARLRRTEGARPEGRDLPCDDGASSHRAAPGHARKSYAPDPIGLVRPSAPEMPAATAAPDVVGQFRVSNLGTLIDVWA